jgi:Na+-transporting NADH:ubiquinone oxidoreductase subunit C
MPSKDKDSIANTFLVSIVLCVVCSLLVSGAAVVLKPLQQKNKLLDKQKNIIAAAGLSEDANSLSGKEIEEIFKAKVTRKMVDLSTGEYLEDDPSFDPLKAAKDPATQAAIEGFDIGLANRETKTLVYLVQDANGKIEKVVLPIYGMGLWSTLYGFVALEADLKTVSGLTYYQHGETPGLGGEVENPAWKAKWVGKKIWTEGITVQNATNDDLRIGVAKGAPTSENAEYMVDGLSGATITSRGVDSMLKYWFSSYGFGPFLQKLASQQGAGSGETNS